MFRSIYRCLEQGLKFFFIGLIWLYQKVVSPCLKPNCRFYPTCSNYCLESFKQHHFIFALWLSIKRLLKCHPWHQGGFDPVPKNTNIKEL